MQSISNDNFGPLIAYLIPGATALWGASVFWPPLRELFAVGVSDVPTIGGFLYLTLLSLGAGMTVTAIRWALVDTLHRLTGLPSPQLNFARLQDRKDAFALLIEIHYRHYQFYANMFVAVAIVYGCYGVHYRSPLPFGWWGLAFLALELVFLATSRDTLEKYYSRSGQLLTAKRT